MDASTNQHGEYIFTKQVMVDENSAIEYKYRHADGDWWALDPNTDTGEIYSLRLEVFWHSNI